MARPGAVPRANLEGLKTDLRRNQVLAKVFPLKLKDGNQAATEALDHELLVSL